MTYQVELLAEVQGTLRRLRAVDPAGAQLVADTVRGLAADPRPTGVHVLSDARGLHRVHMSRIDRGAGHRVAHRGLVPLAGLGAGPEHDRPDSALPGDVPDPR